MAPDLPTRISQATLPAAVYFHALSRTPLYLRSRLTAALLEKLASEPHTRLRYFCSPQHTDSALYPVISQMERAAGFVHDDIPQARLDKLDVMLAQTSTSKKDAALFAEMLSLPNDGRYPAIDLAPEQRRQSQTPLKRKHISSAHSRARGNSNQKPGSYGPP